MDNYRNGEQMRTTDYIHLKHNLITIEMDKQTGNNWRNKLERKVEATKWRITGEPLLK